MQREIIFVVLLFFCMLQAVIICLDYLNNKPSTIIEKSFNITKSKNENEVYSNNKSDELKFTHHGDSYLRNESTFINILHNDSYRTNLSHHDYSRLSNDNNLKRKNISRSNLIQPPLDFAILGKASKLWHLLLSFI